MHSILNILFGKVCLKFNPVALDVELFLFIITGHSHYIHCLVDELYNGILNVRLDFC